MFLAAFQAFRLRWLRFPWTLFATTPVQVSLIEEYARHQRPIDDEFERRWEVGRYRTF
jgi:hypothetical protein